MSPSRAASSQAAPACSKKGKEETGRSWNRARCWTSRLSLFKKTRMSFSNALIIFTELYRRWAWIYIVAPGIGFESIPIFSKQKRLVTDRGAEGEGISRVSVKVVNPQAETAAQDILQIYIYICWFHIKLNNQAHRRQSPLLINPLGVGPCD